METQGGIVEDRILAIASTVESNLIDRTEWVDGPWDGEVDKVVWVDPDTGLECAAIRNDMGAWCGYVGVTPDHPLYGADIDRAMGLFEVHGGITYAWGHNDRIPFDRDAWVFGFDCAHMDDRMPYLASLSREWEVSHSGIYRTLGYVVGEVTNLARQAHDLGSRWWPVV